MASGDSLCYHNLVNVAAQLFLAGAVKADLTYSMLDAWRQRFTEADVSMIATLLHTAGLQLRAGGWGQRCLCCAAAPPPYLAGRWQQHAARLIHTLSTSPPLPSPLHLLSLPQPTRWL